MPVLTFPGLYFTEQGGIPIVSAPSPDVGGFECLTKRGSTTQLGFVTSWSQFTRLYGEYMNTTVYGEYFGPHCVRQFFDNGGASCWIARVVDPLDAVASVTITAIDETAAFATISAIGAGEGGNDLAIATTRISTTLNLGGVWDLDVTTNLIVTNAAGFEVGDVVTADDGTNRHTAIVQSIDIATNTLRIVVGVGLTGVADGTILSTTSRHRVATTLASSVIATATSAELTDASRVGVGTILTFGDATVPPTVTEQRVVTGRTGNTVTFAALTNPYAAADPVTSQEFRLQVYENNVLLETHDYLNVSATSADYLDTRLSGVDNESNLISAVVGAGIHTVTDFRQSPQETGGIGVGSTVPGTDAGPLADAEWQGSESAKTGLYLFDNAAQINFFSLPDVDTIPVFQSANTYALNRADTMFIGHVDAADDTMAEAFEFRKYELGIDSSYSALYFPWVQVADPDIDGHTITIPPDGTVQGVYAYTTRTRGFHKAPANVPLNNILGLAVDINDQEQGQLNPIGVNVIRNFAERGFRIWGARTLWTVEDGFHYVNIRRVVTYIRVSILSDSGWVVFEPNDSATRTRLYLSIRRLFNSLYRDGALYAPSGAAPESERGAYFIKCDDENNPPSAIEAGNLTCDMGVRPTPPAEFVIFNLALISGEVAVTGP